MDKNIIKQTFHFDHKIVARMYGHEATVVEIFDGEDSCFRAGICEYQILDTVDLEDLGGVITNVFAVQWEDGITRTEHRSQRITDSRYQAVIALPMSKVA